MSKIIVTGILAFTFLCLATMAAGVILARPSLVEPAPEKVVVVEPAVEQVAEPASEKVDMVEKPAPEPAAKQAIEMIGSNSDSKVESYSPPFSCSDLSSCTTTVVPDGYFSIGYKSAEEGCNWVLFKEGEEIDYNVIDEFHTYNKRLPLTAFDGFARSQTPWVLACQQ